MQQSNVIIRGVERIDKIDPRIITALSDLKPTDSVPIYYTGGLMPEVPTITSDPNWCIGIATNCHKDEHGNFVCDVTLNDFLSATSNYDGVIDNIICVGKYYDDNGNEIKSADDVTDKSEMRIKVEQFVVYDLDMKHQFDAMVDKHEEGSDVAREGAAGDVRIGDNPLKDVDVQQAIAEDIEAMKERGGYDGEDTAVQSGGLPS